MWCEAWEGLEGVGSKDSFFFIYLYSESSPLWAPFYVGEALASPDPSRQPVLITACPKTGCESRLLSSSIGLANAVSLMLALTFCWPVWISALNQCLAFENSTLSLPLMLTFKNILFIF